MFKMRLAETNDVDVLNDLYNECINVMNDLHIFQWNKIYPNKKTYERSIKQNTQYIFEEDDLLIGSVIMNEIQAEEWSEVEWNISDGNCLVIHALAISPKVQGRGYGQKSLKLCEELGAAMGYTSIRLDAFSENPVALKLYEKNAYTKVGEVTFNYKPEGHQKYICYEKCI